MFLFVCDVHSVSSDLVPCDNPLPPLSPPPHPHSSVTVSQICREAEAAIFHQQLFEELRRLTPLSSDPTEVTAIGAVESSFKCCAGAIIVLTTTGRCVNQTQKNVWLGHGKKTDSNIIPELLKLTKLCLL